jgi:hypothetical protein
MVGYLLLLILVALCFVAGLKLAAQALRKVRQSRTLPLGLDEAAGTYSPIVEWAPSPEAQHRANLWAFVCRTLRGRPRQERRKVFFTLLRRDFKNRTYTMDDNRAERRRVIRGG